MASTKQYHSIAELLDEPGGTEDLNWIANALQWAIEIELFTLPPYLCARWSIDEDGGTATTRMRKIARDEMNHLAWVANMLAGIGFAPQLRDTAVRRVVPDYRVYDNPSGGVFPGGVHAAVRVTLGGLTDAQLKLFMTIEEPEVPLPKFLAGRVTIGMFYDRLMGVLRRERPRFVVERQLSRVTTFADVDAALTKLDQIGKEGEGTNDSPYYDGRLTHHYVFGEILHRKAFIEGPPGKWGYRGDDVPFPRSVRALTGPATPQDNNNAAFNHIYSQMLSHLHDAWNGRGSTAFTESVNAMRAMEGAARRVMEAGVWPTFRYVPR